MKRTGIAHIVSVVAAAAGFWAFSPAEAETIDGDCTISADTTLTEDLTVTGTLTLENSATVDLDGHKLIVGGLACPSQNIVVNGDFETDPLKLDGTGVYPISDWSYYLKDGTGAKLFTWSGWTNDVGGGLTANKNSNTWTSSSLEKGKYAAFIHGKGGSGRHLAQKLPAVPAGVYFWSLKYARRAGGDYYGTGFKFDLLLEKDGTSKTLGTMSATENAPWKTPYGTTTIEEAGSYTLKLKIAASSVSHNSAGAVFDDIVFRQVAFVTDTSTGAPGELRIDVPENTTLENESVVVSGNLNFVKDGAGTYTCATEGLMAYRGGTCVEGGTYLCGLDGSKGPFGPTYSGGNILVNGNFNADPSTGAISSGYQYYNDGSRKFDWDGWGASTVGSGLAKQNSTFVGNLSVGTYAAFIHGPGGSGRCIAQELSSVSAGIYSLSFKYAPSRAACKFDCLLEGEGTTLTLFTGKSASIASGKTWNETPWTTSSYTVDVKESGSYTLKFRISDSSPNNYTPGFVLDDVVFKRMDDVHIAAGATLDLNGKKDFGDYRFVLDGGTIANTGADVGEGTAQLANLVLTADSALDVQKSMGMVGSSYAATSIDLGGNTLAVNVASGKTFWLFNADVTAGTLDISGAGTVKVDKTGLRAADATLKVGCALNGAVAMTVANYIAAYAGSGNTATGKMTVYGTFRPEAAGYYVNCELQNGATLDLSAGPGSLPLAGVSFASGAAIDVNLAGRAALRPLTKRDAPYIVSWSSRPSATFTLDSATSARGYRIETDATGIKLLLYCGATIIIR